MICKNCGMPLENGAMFCGNCGTRVEAQPETPASDPNGGYVPPISDPNGGYVPPAGNPNGGYVPPAGNPNGGYVPPISDPNGGYYNPVPPQPQKKDKSMIYLIICIAVVVVAAAAIFGMKFLGNNNGNEGGEQPGQEIQQNDNGYVQEDPEEFNEIDSDVIRNIINQNSSYTDFGIYVRNLNNGYEFGYGKDTQFLASAMCQVVILDTLSKTVEQNSLDIDYEYVYFDYFANGKEAPSSKYEDGSQITVRKCVEDVAIYGDNNKSNHLVDFIGRANNTSNGFNVINNMLRNNGYVGTSINRKTFINTNLIDYTASPNTTTPYEIANIFESLINNCSYGNSSYMKNIFKSVSGDGSAIGLKKYLPYYNVYNVNALNNQSTNNVAIIEDGGKAIVVAILSTTDENRTNIENNEQREKVQQQLIEYIVSTQFNY